MDISAVENKIKAGSYISALEFATDVRKIWNNVLLVAEENSDTFLKAKELSAYFETLFKEVENEMLTLNDYDLQPEHKGLLKEKRALNPPTNMSKSITNIQKSSIENSKMGIPYSERVQLGQMIRRLPTEFQEEVFQIVSDGPSEASNNSEHLEFDITTLPTGKIRELKQYIDSKLESVNRVESDANADEEIQTKINLHDTNPKPTQGQEVISPFYFGFGINFLSIAISERILRKEQMQVPYRKSRAKIP